MKVLRDYQFTQTLLAHESAGERLAPATGRRMPQPNAPRRKYRAFFVDHH